MLFRFLVKIEFPGNKLDELRFWYPYQLSDGVLHDCLCQQVFNHQPISFMPSRVSALVGAAYWQIISSSLFENFILCPPSDFLQEPTPVSYTHLTLPTNREV